MSVVRTVVSFVPDLGKMGISQGFDAMRACMPVRAVSVPETSTEGVRDLAVRMRDLNAARDRLFRTDVYGITDMESQVREASLKTQFLIAETMSRLGQIADFSGQISWAELRGTWDGLREEVVRENLVGRIAVMGPLGGNEFVSRYPRENFQKAINITSSCWSADAGRGIARMYGMRLWRDHRVEQRPRVEVFSGYTSLDSDFTEGYLTEQKHFSFDTVKIPANREESALELILPLLPMYEAFRIEAVDLLAEKEALMAWIQKIQRNWTYAHF